jgi:glycerol-3-phosphate dehydrogenase (NAD(P)+)
MKAYNGEMRLKAPLGIVGAGAWGTALAYGFSQKMPVVLLAHNAAELKKKQRHLDKQDADVQVIGEIDHLFDACHMIILAMPFQIIHKWIQKQSRVYNLKNHIWINASKGISTESLKLFPQMVPKGSALGVLSGPSFATELLKSQPTSLVFASTHKRLCATFQQKFSHTFLRIYTQPDPMGVSAGGALKNVLAIGSGMAHGLGLQKNAISALVTRGIWEIARLTSSLGGRSQTVFGLSGLGDILLSCYSENSRNMRFGIRFGSGEAPLPALKSIGSTVEGYATAKAIQKIISKKRIDAPICSEVYKVLYRSKDPHKSLVDLMRRPVRQEIFPK